MRLSYLLRNCTIAASVMVTAIPVFADTPENNIEAPVKKNLIEMIEEESDGRIEIDMPNSIIDNLLKYGTGKKTTVQKTTKPVEKKKVVAGPQKVDGYRIQVFSDGGNKGNLESKARARANAVAAKFPEFRGKVVSFSKGPNWYAQVGAFEDSKAANAALARLRAAFPSFAAEMRLVRAKITVVK